MTARNLTAGMLSAITAGTIRPALFYEGEFVAEGSPSEVPAFARFWTGIGTISWNGYSWIGGGNLLSVSPIDESIDLQAKGFAITISGMPSAAISIALNGVRQGRKGTVWLGLYDASNALVADPYQLQRGKFDFSVVEDNGATCTVTAQYESQLIDLEKPRKRYYTSEDQALDYPADTGFRFVPSLQQKDIVWG